MKPIIRITQFMHTISIYFSCFKTWSVSTPAGEMDKVQWKKGIKNDDHMQNEARYCSKQAWQKNNLETEKDKYASLTEK